MTSRIVQSWATVPLHHAWRLVPRALHAWPIPRRMRGQLAYWLFGGWIVELFLLVIYTYAVLIVVTAALCWLLFGVTVGLATRLVIWLTTLRRYPDKEIDNGE
jgi:hypothetical protein